MEDKKQKTIDYINEVLRPPRQEFGGLPVCPFAGPELDNGKLMIDIINEEQSLDFLLDKYKNSKYNSALLILELPEGEVLTAEETKEFQVFVNKIIRYKGYNRSQANKCSTKQLYFLYYNSEKIFTRKKEL